MSKVYLGVGHGGKDPGAVKYVTEKDVNLKMALACKDYLEANGVEVKLSRTSDVNKDLNSRISECNKYNPDLAVDIHNNAGGGDGFEVYHTIYGGKGKTLAQNIEKEVKTIGQNSRGCKTKKRSDGTDYYGFIKFISCPSIICEGAFVDNKADASQIDEDKEAKAFGQAYAKGILKTLGVNSNNKPNITQKETEKDRIKDLQKALNKDFKAGLAVDGMIGPATTKAVMAHYLKYFTRGEFVKWTQRQLKRKGYNIGSYGIDGGYGRDTEAAVKKYQKDKKLTVDKCVGIEVVKSLVK